MNKNSWKILSLATAIILFMSTNITSGTQSTGVRVPAEWEQQEAIWLQWPGRYEKTFEPTFAEIAAIIVHYEKLRVLCDSEKILREARAAIQNTGIDPDHENIEWHILPNNNAWMRDNGPVYIIKDNKIVVQDWQFNAWGGAFGSDVEFQSDNEVPYQVARLLELPYQKVNIVHERGNLEFNGVDTVLLNWSVIGDENRNPGYSREQAQSDLEKYFGVSKVIFVEGVPEGDLTKGHIDGIARFINSDTVVVPKCTRTSKCKPGDQKDDLVFNSAAATIEAAGFNVIRDPIEGIARYKNRLFNTNYMNWLVGNGFVIVVGFENKKTDLAAKARIESYFPGRRAHVVNMLESWASGGGIHCHTNDQPSRALVN